MAFLLFTQQGSPQFTPLWCQIDTKTSADAGNWLIVWLPGHCPQDILKYHHPRSFDYRPRQRVLVWMHVCTYVRMNIQKCLSISCNGPKVVNESPKLPKTRSNDMGRTSLLAEGLWPAASIVFKNSQLSNLHPLVLAKRHVTSAYLLAAKQGPRGYMQGFFFQLWLI